MWCLVRGMLALICYARADVQLLQLVAQGSQDGGAGPESDQDCHTSVEGDECYEKVVWAMRTGVGDHPEWYAPLTGNSSFEDFQRFLHSMARLSNVCPEPCADQDSGARLPARLPAGAEDCHTSVEGDECYEKVAWAMRTGVGDHPEWYAPLTGNSSFEDFQRLLHSTARLSNVCPVPCTLETSAGHCRTSVQGDACYEKVVRAMQIGVVDHPDWYAPLTARSSFKQFQQFLHGVDSLSHVCPEPCASQAGETDCHTSVEGDACHEKVVWAMQFGFQQHPEWYAPLAWNSSFEDFQRLLHSTARLSLVCPEPCAEQDSGTQLPARLPAGAEECHTSVEGDDCYEKVKWAMHTGIMKVPEWYVPLTRHSSFEDFQQLLHDTPRLSRTCPRPCLPLTAPERLGTPMPTEIHFDELFNSTYPGFAQVATNCMCGNSMFGGQLNDEFTTLERCAEECRYRPTCLAFGLHPWQSIWNGHCDLFDVACNYTDGHAAGTTCSDPLPDGALNVVFNKIPTPQPTASPTPAALVDPCDVTDGSSPSQVYPCSCGTETCFSSEICSRDRSGASCAPPQHLRVEWPCRLVADIGSPFFSLWATSATGAPAYSNGDGAYLYWDPSCDGVQRVEQQPRWIIDSDEPSMTATMDLDADGACEYFGHFASEELRGATLGNTTWEVACGTAANATISNATVTITYVQVPPSPAPTLQPGAPCACAAEGCGYFPYMDLDGDGCLVEAEVDKVPEIAGMFAEMDDDGDGCVTQTECAANLPTDSDLPTFPIAPPDECGYGFYFEDGTSVCQECPAGEARRRRAESCTDCPAGKEDVGDFDNCIAGVYLMQPVEPGDTRVYVNTDVDETGLTLTIGDGISIITRNPEHFERFVIVNKVRFDDANLTGQRREILYFDLDHVTHLPFNKYDIVISACTGVNGIDLSNSYPCGCGKQVCGMGFRCDEYCASQNESFEVYDAYKQLKYGHTGCCIGPSVSTLPTPAPTVQAIGDPHLVNLQGEHFDINHGGRFVLLRIPQDVSKPVEIALEAQIRPEHGKPCTTYITQVELFGAWLGDQSLQVRSYLRSHSVLDADEFLGMRVVNRRSDSEKPWENITDWTDEAEVVFGDAGNSDFRLTLTTTHWHSRKRERRGSPTVGGQFLVRLTNVWHNESAEVRIRQDLPTQEHLNVAVRRLGVLGRADIGGLLGFDSHPASLEDVTPECQRHRDGLDVKKGPRSRPAWQTRWEKLKQHRAQDVDGMIDNEVASTLLSTGRESMEFTGSKMCVCANDESVDRADVAKGVIADFQIGRFAEASWD